MRLASCATVAAPELIGVLACSEEPVAAGAASALDPYARVRAVRVMTGTARADSCAG